MTFSYTIVKAIKKRSQVFFSNETKLIGNLTATIVVEFAIYTRSKAQLFQFMLPIFCHT